ncbi:hypothetical protein [Chryseobacterium gwangjuense]|uniref:hypothetical protein n=1 Tax=Chryseobacterium gwangjuense TaxID=1069980 RepID=UPI001E597416|nr:hypothetical protein [Chryseobacterium gwangjuense]MCE3076337.1 hypothetical protein [Chryseobacterium gwangjuense]
MDKNNNKTSAQLSYVEVFLLKIVLYLVAGGIAVESIFTVSTFVGDTGALLCTDAESELLLCIDDSLVPQLTTNTPKPKVSNKNFFINIYFLV